MFFFCCYGSMAASLLPFQCKEMFSTWLYFSIDTMGYLDWYHYNSQSLEICQYNSHILKCTIINLCFPRQCHFLRLPATWAHCQAYVYCMSFRMDVFAPVLLWKEPASVALARTHFFLSLTRSLFFSTLTNWQRCRDFGHFAKTCKLAHIGEDGERAPPRNKANKRYPSVH
jgi:hypothetical protein